MWLRLRNTARRGRSCVPARWRRIRSWRLRRAAPRLATCVIVLVPRLSDRLAEKAMASLAPSRPHARTLQCARFGRSTPPHPDSPSRRSISLLLAADLAGLAGLAADVLARVADALALVRLGLARRADLGGNLADELLVDAEDREVGRVLDFEADPGRRRDLDRVAVAQVELQLLADLRSAVSDAGDLERLAIAVGHPDDHVVDERPGQAVELLVGLLLGRARDDQAIVLAGDRHVRMQLPRQRALGALDRERAPVDRHIDARRDGDGKATNSRHRPGLPDVREDFAAQLRLARLLAGHDPLAGADDDDAEAAEDSWDVGLARVDTQARLADPLEPGDDGHFAVDVLELEPQDRGGPRLLFAHVGNEALVLEDAGDLALRARRRHDHFGVARPRRVPNARQHVRNRVGNIHRSLTSSTSSRRAARRGAHAPGSRSGTGRTAA